MSASSHVKAFVVVFVLACITFFGYRSTVAQEEPSIPIRLTNETFDPLSQTPSVSLPEHLLFHESDVHGSYYIVQFNGPVDESDKAAVTTVGGTLFDYIPEYAFIVRMDTATKAHVSALQQVRWIGVYQPAYRIAANLRPYVAATQQTGEQTSSDATSLPVPDTVDLAVMVFPGEDVHQIATVLENQGATIESVTQSTWRSKITLETQPALISTIASLDGVSWVEEAPQWEPHNEVAHTDSVMDVEDVWTRGYYGDSQTVAIADTQLDTGSSATYVDDFRECTGTTPRVTISQLGTATSDTSGHGTHVAGSVLGNGRLDGASCGNYAGFAAGSAPQAHGYFQAIMDTDGTLGGIPADLNDLFQPAYDVGARIHTNSWGASLFGAYTSNSQEADQFAWNNKDFFILFSAGNSGQDVDADGVIDLVSLGAPGTAKNVFTVGASENPGQGSGTWNTWYTPVAPINGDPYTDDVDGLAAFSSRGPTDDGRIKPDIVAPGIFVRSVRSTEAGGSGDYVLNAGTSMATPLTAGAASVAREVFSVTQTYTPTAAMLKSLLANGATDTYPGQYGTGAGQEIATTRPTNQAGWGRVDLEDSLFSTSGRTYWWDQTDTLQSSLNDLGTGDTVTYTFEITSSTVPLAATLAWTDYPGTPAAAGGLVNDLDMHLEGPGGTTYYPNNAIQRASSELLDPTGGAFTHIRTFDSGETFAVLLSPSQFPAGPAFAKLWFYNTGSAAAGSVTFDLVLYNNDGAGGTPGTSLCTVPGNRAAWGSPAGFYPVVVDIGSCSDIAPATGDFFLSVEFTSSPPSTARFLMQQVSSGFVSWYDTGSGWTQDSEYNYGWAGVVYEPVSPATPYDRVNNLVGIDVPAPSTGVYTLTVSGFNVPTGPQPYALTLSGASRLLGTETVTRTIDGPGTYKFGNTGVAMTFNNEDVDAVAVTVFRDRFPSTNVNDELINRSYEITATGGSGTFDADVTFGYEDAELNGQTESQLDAYRWNGSSWDVFSADSVDTVNDTVTVTGVTTFSRWALGSGPAPTTVSLTIVQAAPVGGTSSVLGIVLLTTFGLGVVVLRRRGG